MRGDRSHRQSLDAWLVSSIEDGPADGGVN
jgi:hypothetical protein